uniref:Caspase family p20 domain-containing protein n=1 Tax=Chelydra serpentina TaxID=8475 RepID=A0A8C3XJI0_CHESE
TSRPHLSNRAVIIVNYKFYGSPEPLEPRSGAKREADKLFKALSKLNYAVKLHYDQEGKEIEEIYRQESREEHGDCFVSILSSHGEEGAIYDCRGEPVKLTRIFQMLSPQSCPVLAGKPKIFFIQRQLYSFIAVLERQIGAGGSVMHPIHKHLHNQKYQVHL